MIPDMFGQLTTAQMEQLEKIKVSLQDETHFGSQVLKEYEASLSARKIGPRSSIVAAEASEDATPVA